MASNESATARIRASSGMSSTRAAARIAGSVPALVVEEDARERIEGRADGAQHARTRGRVPPDLHELDLVQRAGLEQHFPRHGELPDVVQHGSGAQAGDALAIEVGTAREAVREHRYARRMAPCEGVALLDGCRQSGEESHGPGPFKTAPQFPPS